MMEMEKNLSCVLHGINDLRMEDMEVPVPRENQLFIRVNTVGICGSDVHFFTHGAIGQFIVKEPLVLGHESCGTVIGWGNKVTGFNKGPSSIKSFLNLFFKPQTKPLKISCSSDFFCSRTTEIFSHLLSFSLKKPFSISERCDARFPYTPRSVI